MHRHKVAFLLRENFLDFPPESFRFPIRALHGEPTGCGQLEVEIQMMGTATVRVVHVDANSITLGAVEGHPEAGRITFGAYCNDREDVIFHIRSRARSSSSMRYAGFLSVGESMQTNTWTDFIDRLAHTVGEGVIGAIRVGTREVDEEEGEETMHAPTFIATAYDRVPA